MSNKTRQGKQGRRHNRKLGPLPPYAKVTPLNVSAIAAKMQAEGAPQSEATTQFSPGTPVKPIASLVSPRGPRGWTFPVGYNISQEPRSTETNSFDTLRNLASLYDGIMLCEQVWFDLCSRLEIEIKPTPEALEAAGGDPSVFAEDIARYKEFFNNPDPNEGLDLKAWIRKALKDQLELDALVIFVERDRLGRPLSLQLIDGATFKPLIDDRGRTPQYPYPAYQQFWQGAPLGWYTTYDIIYERETPRTDSVYGLSRVERIIMRVNQALRKQNKDLSAATEGNLPPGILEMPEPPDGDQWTPEDMIEYQTVWDGILAGNDQMRSRLKVVQPGAKFTAIGEPVILTALDMFILNTCAACYGLTMADLAFTENVNKSSGDSQENVIYRRAMRPLMNRYAELFTKILRKYFQDTRFTVSWRGFEETEDIKTQADAYGAMVAKGLLDIATANRLMNLPAPEQDIPRFVLTATGPVFFNQVLDPDVLKAQKDATMAGFALAKQSPGTQPGQDDKEVPEDDKEDANAPRTLLSEEYRRWRDVATYDIKRERPIRDFMTAFIPSTDQAIIRAGLSNAKTVEDVRAVFNALRLAQV